MLVLVIGSTVNDLYRAGDVRRAQSQQIAEELQQWEQVRNAIGDTAPADLRAGYAVSFASLINPQTPGASAVFTARATDKVSGGADDFYEFAVSEVFKGEVGNVTTVGTASQGASCGASYQVGREYLLFVSNGGVGVAWESNLCLGPTEQSDTWAALESVYGAAQPPNASAPDSRISRWSRTTAVVPVPLLALASVVTVGAVWWAAVAILRRRRAGDLRQRRTG